MSWFEKIRRIKIYTGLAIKSSTNKNHEREQKMFQSKVAVRIKQEYSCVYETVRGWNLKLSETHRIFSKK